METGARSLAAQEETGKKERGIRGEEVKGGVGKTKEE